MKILRLFTFLLIFIFFTIQGFSFGTTGKGFATLKEASAAAAINDAPEPVAAEPVTEADVSHAPPTTPTLDVIQHENILIIGVDQVTDPVVNLEAVWMLIYHRDTPVVEIIPIFPTITGDDLMRDYEIAGNFKLTPEGAPGEDFLNTLKSRDILWHNYVLLDERALNAITELMEVPRGRDNGHLHHWDDDSQASINGQLALFDQVCKSFAQRELVEDIFLFISDQSPFLSTDVPVEQIVADWRLLRVYGENLRCEFPTLTVPQE
ncbi:MAG: hypothetical protein H8D37_00015 [Chloroflexi bacterium]|nr:hypothetical protein [Chloroflexota bacterium]